MMRLTVVLGRNLEATVVDEPALAIPFYRVLLHYFYLAPFSFTSWSKVDISTVIFEYSQPVS